MKTKKFFFFNLKKKRQKKKSTQRKEGTHEKERPFLDHCCLFMTHFERMRLQDNKRKSCWFFWLSKFKRSMTMKEYVYIIQAVLHSVAIALLQSPSFNCTEWKVMVRPAYWDTFPSVLTSYQLKVHN